MCDFTEVCMEKYYHFYGTSFNAQFGQQTHRLGVKSCAIDWRLYSNRNKPLIFTFNITAPNCPLTSPNIGHKCNPLRRILGWNWFIFCKKFDLGYCPHNQSTSPTFVNNWAQACHCPLLDPLQRWYEMMTSSSSYTAVASVLSFLKGNFSFRGR